MSDNSVLKRIFGPKRDEVTGGWRKLHNEQLHNLYSSPSKMRWAGYVAACGRSGMYTEFWWEARRKETTGKT
jgi:hypothetical protein